MNCTTQKHTLQKQLRWRPYTAQSKQSSLHHITSTLFDYTFSMCPKYTILYMVFFVVKRCTRALQCAFSWHRPISLHLKNNLRWKMWSSSTFHPIHISIKFKTMFSHFHSARLLGSASGKCNRKQTWRSVKQSQPCWRNVARSKNNWRQDWRQNRQVVEWNYQRRTKMWSSTPLYLRWFMWIRRSSVPSIQQFGRSNIACQRLASSGVESIQLTSPPSLLPTTFRLETVRYSQKAVILTLVVVRSHGLRPWPQLSISDSDERNFVNRVLYSLYILIWLVQLATSKV